MAYINVDEVFILDNTGLQVDQVTDLPYTNAGLSESQQAQARANIGAGGTNPNLLDNPFFTVNQRGVSGTLAGGKFGVDRWYFNATSSASTNMGTGYIELPAGGQEVYQTIEDLSFAYGKYITYSVLDNTGEIRQASLVMPTAPSVQNYINTTINGVRLRLRYVNPTWRVFMDSQDGTVHTMKAAKLELGSVSTLANDAPPNYAEELLKCQRHFYRLTAGNMDLSIVCAAVTASIAFGTLQLGVPMRATPTLTVAGTIYISDYANANITVSSASKAVSNTQQIVIRFDTASSITAGRAYLLRFGSSAYIDLSADL